jgi:hypothetical protein
MGSTALVKHSRGYGYDFEAVEIRVNVITAFS